MIVTDALGSLIFLITLMTKPLRLAGQSPTTVWQRVSYSRGRRSWRRKRKNGGKGEKGKEKVEVVGGALMSQRQVCRSPPQEDRKLELLGMENEEFRMVVVVGGGGEKVEVVGGCINGSKDRFAGLHFDEMVSWSCQESFRMDNEEIRMVVVVIGKTGR